MDSCMPPKPFWQKFGFEVIRKVPNGQTWDEIKTANLGDDPRNSPTEMELKKQIVKSLEDPKSSEENWAYDFDMEKSIIRQIEDIVA